MNLVERYRYQIDENGYPVKIDVWKETCTRRNITHLVHVTELRYLESIIQHGLIPKNMSYIYFSVTRPNYVFVQHKLYKENCKPEQIIALLIDIQFLLNQSSQDVKFYSESPDYSNANPCSFKDLFASQIIYGKNKILFRKNQDLARNLTTSPQAAVLISKQVPVQSIKEILCMRAKNYQQIRQILDSNNANAISLVLANSFFFYDTYWTGYRQSREAAFLESIGFYDDMHI